MGQVNLATRLAFHGHISLALPSVDPAAAIGGFGLQSSSLTPSHTLQTTALVNETYLTGRSQSHAMARSRAFLQWRRRQCGESSSTTRDRARDKRGGAVVFTAISGEEIAWRRRLMPLRSMRRSVGSKPPCPRALLVLSD
jgi:hypothetical protein